MPERLGDRRFQVRKINQFGHEIERAAVHRGADIGHVAIGRDDNVRDLLLVLRHLDTLLPAKAKVAKLEHHPATAHAKLPSFMSELQQRPGLPAIQFNEKGSERQAQEWAIQNRAGKFATIAPYDKRG
jgi:hypothetical protein